MDLMFFIHAILIGVTYKLVSALLKATIFRAEKDKQAGSATAPAKLELAAELHHGVVYCFEKETDRFVCQGRTLDELIQVYKSRFPYRKEAVAITKFTPEVKDHLERHQREFATSSITPA